MLSQALDKDTVLKVTMQIPPSLLSPIVMVCFYACVCVCVCVRMCILVCNNHTINRFYLSVYWLYYYA